MLKLGESNITFGFSGLKSPLTEESYRWRRFFRVIRRTMTKIMIKDRLTATLGKGKIKKIGIMEGDG